jgi:hypothetical protein
MTLDDLMTLLLNHLHVGQREATAAIEATAKMIAFKYEAELYKVFTKEDITKANEMEEKESLDYLHKRYEEITGEKSDVLLTNITDMIVTDIMKQPRDFFHFSE